MGEPSILVVDDNELFALSVVTYPPPSRFAGDRPRSWEAMRSTLGRTLQRLLDILASAEGQPVSAVRLKAEGMERDNASDNALEHTGTHLTEICQ